MGRVTFHFPGVGDGKGIGEGNSFHQPGVGEGARGYDVRCAGSQGVDVMDPPSLCTWWAALKTSVMIKSRKSREIKGVLRFMG
jgi:hypothetical protein